MTDAGYGAPGDWGPPPQVVDPDRVERGSSRSYTGIAALVASTAMLLSDFAPWGIASVPDGTGTAQFWLTGFGHLIYQSRAGEDDDAGNFVADVYNRSGTLPSPGFLVAILAVVGILGAAAYLTSRARSVAAIAVTASGLLAAVWSLSQLANVGGMFTSTADLSRAHYAAGPGVFAALVSALALAGLGVTGLVLERNVISRTAPYAPAPQGYFVDPSLPTGTLGPVEYPATPAAAIAVPPAHPSRIPGAPATPWPRAIAAAIDIGLTAFVSSFVLIMIGVLGDSGLSYGPLSVIWWLLAAVLIAPLPLAYFALVEARGGRTLGKLITGLEVQGPTGLAPSLRESLRRNAVHSALGVTLACAAITSAQLGAVPGGLMSVLAGFAGITYVIWLITMGVSAYSDPAHNAWHLGVHDRFADGPTRVVNRTPAPLPQSGPVPLTPWCTAAAVLVLLLGLTGAADSLMRSRSVTDSPAPAVALTQTVTVQTPAPPDYRPQPAAPELHPAAVGFPADSRPCPQRYGLAGAYRYSAVGNDHTSCPFAEEVRLAYADLTAPGSVQQLIVRSPVTKTNIPMTCGPAGNLIVCRGGNDAVVFVK